MKQGVFKVCPGSFPQAPSLNSLYSSSSTWWLVEARPLNSYCQGWKMNLFYVSACQQVRAQRWEEKDTQPAKEQHKESPPKACGEKIFWKYFWKRASHEVYTKDLWWQNILKKNLEKCNLENISGKEQHTKSPPKACGEKYILKIFLGKGQLAGRNKFTHKFATSLIAAPNFSWIDI